MMATVALDCNLLTFSRETYDHFYNPSDDSPAWKNNVQATVQAQLSEQALKILQHN